LCFQVGQKAAVGAAGNFKTDPFLLFCDPAQGVAAAETRFLSSDITISRHKKSL
jgi:hypothetical protein